MYAIYAYIDPPNHPNVGIHAIHGVSGTWIIDPLLGLPTKDRVGTATRPPCEELVPRGCDAVAFAARS